MHNQNRTGLFNFILGLEVIASLPPLLILGWIIYATMNAPYGELDGLLIRYLLGFLSLIGLPILTLHSKKKGKIKIAWTCLLLNLSILGLIYTLMINIFNGPIAF